MTVEDETRLGYIFRFNISRERGITEEFRGVKRGPTNRGRDHTQGLSFSIKYKSEQ